MSEKVRRTRCKKCLELNHPVNIYRLKYDKPAICKQCAPDTCCVCLGPVTDEEKRQLQVLKTAEVFGDGEEPEIIIVERGLYLCTTCHLSERVDELDQQIKILKRKKLFQKMHHLCACGRINDNRDPVTGRVNSKKCTVCWQIATDKGYLNHVAIKGQDRNPDPRNVVFSRMTGFEKKS